jgi:hypothetical protein
MQFAVTKGFHFNGELFTTGSTVNAEDLPENIIDWLQLKGCLMPTHAEPAERKPKPRQPKRGK